MILVNEIENPLRFPGQYFDAETGLHYNYFRFFDPTTGRYIRPDPIGLAGGVNMFGYVNANPIRFSDSSGLEGSFIGGFADADDANASGRDLVVGLIGTLAPPATILSLGAVGPTIVANAGEIGRVAIIVGRLLKGELSGPSPPEISPKPPPPNVQSAPPTPNPIPPNLRIPKRLKRSIDVRVISVGQDCR
jgi:RHS repeat-associated protein